MSLEGETRIHTQADLDLCKAVEAACEEAGLRVLVGHDVGVHFSVWWLGPWEPDGISIQMHAEEIKGFTPEGRAAVLACVVDTIRGSMDVEDLPRWEKS